VLPATISAMMMMMIIIIIIMIIIIKIVQHLKSCKGYRGAGGFRF